MMGCPTFCDVDYGPCEFYENYKGYEIWTCPEAYFDPTVGIRHRPIYYEKTHPHNSAAHDPQTVRNWIDANLPPPTTSNVIKFTVKDSVTSMPIAGAYVRLTCQSAGNGTIPFEGYSDSNGLVAIDVSDNIPVLYWLVQKPNYVDASGEGTPPSIVLMDPAEVTIPPAPAPPPPAPPAPPVPAPPVPVCEIAPGLKRFYETAQRLGLKRTMAVIERVCKRLSS